MTKRDADTLDLFTAARGAEPLAGEWPEAARFPLNRDDASVADIVLADLKASKRPLIVTGYAGLDRLVEFVAEADADSDIRVVFGSEPYDTGGTTWAVGDYDLPRAMKEYWLERGFSVLLSSRVLTCLERLRSGRLRARYVARSAWRLHAKLFIGDAAASLGSSNFTRAGFHHQLEANTRFEAGRRGEERRRFDETVQIAEQIWDLGRDFNERLIELLEALLQVVGWRDALARASLELLEGDWAGRYLRERYLAEDAKLWPSQRQGIAQALYILKERGSVLVADATGSGKTRAGMHLIGAKMQEILASSRLRQGKALLICPPSVVESWKDESAKAQVQIDVHSHGALSHARSGNRENVLANLRRAQLLGVDEGHNFLNVASNRTQQLLRNMADHVMLFTATPINKSAQDLLRIADMLGADNLDESTLAAFERMLGVRSITRSLSDEEIAQLRAEIAKFTVRRTKRMLNELIERDPEAYRDAAGRRCRFPEHRARIYRLDEPSSDCRIADEIRELAGRLKGVLHFQKAIVLPRNLARRGVSEERFLAGRLRAATKLSQYMIMQSLRSSRAALIEHLQGTDAAVDACAIDKLGRSGGGNLIASVERIAGHPPKSGLSIELPDWLSDTQAHRQACREDRALLARIAELAGRISDRRERAKAQHLAELSRRFEHVLAFDTRPITLALVRQYLQHIDPDLDVMVATGDAQSQRSGLLRRFSPASREPGRAVGLCSDSVSEGVNLQRAQVVVHLDMPSVVRIAEQRVGRIDRLDSPHRWMEAWWPADDPAFALQSDERFIERFETVDNLLGSNMPLPEEVRASSPVLTAEQAIDDFRTQAGEWDGIEDAFGPVRSLVEGDGSLLEDDWLKAWRDMVESASSVVSAVAAESPWAFFCTADSTGIPRWIAFDGEDAGPVSDLASVAALLRRRLGPEVVDLETITPAAERMLGHFLDRLAAGERRLLSRRKRRALEEMRAVVGVWLDNAGKRQDQTAVDILHALAALLDEPRASHQPDWEEVAARWLDLIRPVWYEKLTEGGRHKPLLLKDIRSAVIDAEERLLPHMLEEFSREFPAQRPVDERIIAAVVGVP
jgi:superfamily II DNA or RNA helicase